MLVDMHIHTNRSDGEMTVDEIIYKVKQSKLSYFSITDHEILTTLTQEQIERSGAHYCPGIEFTCSPNHLHILGYFPVEISKNMTQFINEINAQRTIELMKILRVLRKSGIHLPSNYRINYANLIKYLISIGYEENEKMVKARLFSNPEISEMKRKDPDIGEVVNKIHLSGGLAIAAHPLRENDKKNIDFLLSNNLDGLEVYHPSHSLDEILWLKEICECKNLIVTGGSDAHKRTTSLGEYSNNGKIDVNLIRNFVLKICNS